MSETKAVWAEQYDWRNDKIYLRPLWNGKQHTESALNADVDSLCEFGGGVGNETD